MEYIGWMILGVALLVVEIITPIFFFLWFAIGSFIAGIASFFGLSFSLAVVVIFRCERSVSNPYAAYR